MKQTEAWVRPLLSRTKPLFWFCYLKKTRKKKKRRKKKKQRKKKEMWR
jgi:hypothetical protein